jgi:hypothetical protein
MKTVTSDSRVNRFSTERTSFSKPTLQTLRSSVCSAVRSICIIDSQSLENNTSKLFSSDIVPWSLHLDNLLQHERSVFDTVKLQWNERMQRRESDRSTWYMIPDTSLWVSETGFSDEMILRSAMCTNFDIGATLKSLKKMNKRYLALTSFCLEDQLRSKTLFVLPGLKDRDGRKVFYMRPARFFPEVMSTDNVIDNLAYCMQCMLEDGQCCRDGITFLANMSGWTKVNFTVNYCRRFMCTLQGRDMPVNVKSFIIVDPPSWFGSIWRIIKTILSPAFQRNVHMISSEDLHMYFEEGFTSFLPDEMDMGKFPTDDIVTGFIEDRKRIEIGGEETMQTEMLCL